MEAIADSISKVVDVVGVVVCEVKQNLNSLAEVNAPFASRH